MIIVSDCVRNNLDEGCIKVASSLSRRLKKHGANLIAVNCKCDYADKQISADKLYLKNEIYSSIKSMSGNILYIPFASNTLGTALRTWILHKRSGKKVTVLFTLRWEMKELTKKILRLSKANVITISEDSYEYFSNNLDGINIINIKTGVDSKRFVEVDETKKRELRKKYNIPMDKTVILHVGHLKHGRNIDLFLDVDERYHVLLVFSSVTEQDTKLKHQLQMKKNIQIIEDYIPDIAEIYQAADIYVFPIVEANNSIDIPLSVLEAAGCNKKIVATPYKEIAFFEKLPGLNRVNIDSRFLINECLSNVEKQDNVSTYKIALKYDWDHSVNEILKHVDN